jgi:DNA-directed RNA polymerase specialized sigma24 family protein
MPTPSNPRKQVTMQLEEVKLLTSMMREHQDAIMRLSKRRRKIVLRLRDEKVTYREIAEAMGTTEQSVYKIIRGDL